MTKPVLTATEMAALPGDFPIGSPKSRAAARSKLENLGGEVAPNTGIVFYEAGPRNPDGTLGAPVRVNSTHARIDGGNRPPIEVERLQDETLDEFEARVLQTMADSRGRGKPRGAVFFPPNLPPTVA